MACIIKELEEQWNNLRSELQEKKESVLSLDLTIQLLDVAKKYANDMNNPQAKAEVKNIMDSYANRMASGKMKALNDQVFATNGVERNRKELKMQMQKFVESTNSTGNLPWVAWAVQDFMTKTFKSLTLWMSFGRGINEGIGAGLITFTNKIDQVLHSPFKWEWFAKWLWIESKNLPTAGKIVNESIAWRETSWGNNVWWKLDKDNPEVLNKLSYIPNKMMEVAWWGIDKVVWPMEQVFYDTEFKRIMGKYVIKNGKEASSFLWKDNLSAENKIKKDELTQKWRREARDSTKQAFFDYSNNPLIINKLETYIPFTNFMYNGIKMLDKYPKTFWFWAVLLNNLQYAYGDNVFYLDEEGQKIDAGMSLRLPILASLGLDSVALNMNRMLQIAPGSIGARPASWYSMLTGREDPRFQKFYKSGSFADYADIWLSMMSPPLSKFLNSVINYNKNKDNEGNKYNALASLNESLLYMSTWVIVKDKSVQQAWTSYIDGDYNALLQLSPAQLNKFFQEPSLASKGFNINTINALKKAKDLGIMDFENDPYKQAIITASALPLHEWFVSETRLKTDWEMISNLVETVLGKSFSWIESKDDFSATLAKWKDMYKSPDFKEFEKAIPGMGKAIRHFVENERYYSDRQDAFDSIKSSDPKESINGELKLIALNYRFEGDEGMSLNEKINAIKYGKLDSPMFYGTSKDGVPAHSVVMTDDYIKKLEYKGDLVAHYIEQTNGISALNSLRRSFVDIAKAASSKTEANKYYKLADKMYDLSLKAEHELKVTSNPEYLLFQLSGDSKSLENAKENRDGKNYSRNTGWSSKYNSNRADFQNATKQAIEDRRKKLFDQMSQLSPKEIKWMEMLGTDIEQQKESLKALMGQQAPVTGHPGLDSLFR